MDVNLDDRKIDFELTTAPMNKGRRGADELPTPTRLPRRRGAEGETETLAPGKKADANTSSKPRRSQRDSFKKAQAENAGGKKKSSKKPSKRQKLNAKKSGPAKAKSAKGKNAKSGKKK